MIAQTVRPRRTLSLGVAHLIALFGSGLLLGEAPDRALNNYLSALNGRDSAERLQAVRAIGAMGSAAKAAVPQLVQHLASRDPSWQVREAIASALGNIGPAAAEAIPALISESTNRYPSVRLQAVVALGQVAGGTTSADVGRVLSALANRCEDRRDIVEAAKAGAIKVGSGSLQTTLSMVNEADSSESRRAFVLDVLAAIPTVFPGTAKDLGKSLDSLSPDNRARAIDVMAQAALRSADGRRTQDLPALKSLISFAGGQIPGRGATQLGSTWRFDTWNYLQPSQPATRWPNGSCGSSIR